MTDFQPLGARVLVKWDEAETTTPGGIILNNAERPAQGEVLAIGPQVTDVQVGERVMFGQYSGHDIKVIDGVKTLLMREEDIMGVME